jgi:hypothetical protein
VSAINLGVCDFGGSGGVGRAQAVNLDLDVLLRTRLLVQASSGGGKSWLLRRLTEQMFGKVQVVIIDPEGEFATLRERFGYVLVGKGGETPADRRSAALVAHKLLELNASAVCDLYEMPPRDRHAWVRIFLDALIDAPKKLWHGLVVIVDEAHVFAPEKGAGESEASDAMIGLATRGRKRGFCAVFATQRLGKLRKDAAAELLNVLIGQTVIDVDRKRAADALGVLGKDQHDLFESLRLLKPGRFYGLGRAIANERTLITVGPVTTTHPEAGSTKHSAEPPPPPEKVRALLPKLADLPAEAEAKARTEADLRRENADLKRQLAERPAPAPPERVEVPMLSHEDKGALLNIGNSCDALAERIRVLIGAIERAPRTIPPRAGAGGRSTSATHGRPRRVDTATVRPARGNGDARLPKAERKILTALAQYPDGRTKSQVAVLTAYAVNGGGFNNALSSLRSAGLIEGTDPLRITDAGLDALGDFEPLPIGDELLRHWLGQLGKAERAALEALAESYPDPLSKEEVAERTGYAPDGGGFNNALSRLRTFELITGKGELRASDSLFG